MAMEQDNIQWLLDNMSLERQERYHKSIEDAHRKGVEEGREEGRVEGRVEGREEGREEGAVRAVALQLRKGLVTREVACLTLGVEDSELDAILERYRDAE